MQRRSFLKAMVAVTAAIAAPTFAHELVQLRAERRGHTYIRFASGYEFIINRPLDRVRITWRLYATHVYDFDRRMWVKNRSGVGIVPRTTFNDVSVKTMQDMVAEGILLDHGPARMARYSDNFLNLRRIALSKSDVYGHFAPAKLVRV